MQTVSIQEHHCQGKFFIKVCSLTEIRIILPTATHRLMLVKTVSRTIELALRVFIGKSLLAAAEKAGFLGELCILKAVGSEKAKSCYSFPFMEGFFSCLSLLRKLFSFYSCTMRPDILN